MVNFKLKLGIFVLFLSIMILPRITFASSLIITEIMYNPAGSDTGREWVEVKNISTTTMSLSDGSWRFNDGSSHVISSVSSTNSLIKPNDFAIVADDQNKFKIDYPNFNGIIFDSSFSLKNSDNKILFTNNGLEDSFVEYQINWGASDDGRTLELNNNKWQTSFSIGGTPGADSSIWPDNLPPSLQISLPSQIEINKEAKMTATVVDPENKSLTVSWWFGDDQSATGSEVNHAYSKEGEYVVVAKTIDEQYEVYATSTITVTEAVKAISSNTVTTWAKIELSEILPNPSGSETENEWIELYNNSSTSVSVDRWQIGDSSSRRFTFKVENTNTNIEAYSYLLVKRTTSGISLNNEGEKIILFTPDGSIKDQVTYDKAYEDYSFAHQDGAWQWTIKPTAAKLNDIVLPEEKNENTEENIQTTTKSSSTSTTMVLNNNLPAILDKQVLEQIKLNEIFPNPEGKDDNEWVELKNIGTTTVDLFGYYIDDEDGGSKPYLISTTTPVNAGGYYLLHKSLSKISLGNIRDSVRLLDGNKKEVWSVDYGQTKEGFSYSFDVDNDDWQWTNVLTLGKENVFPIDKNNFEINSALITTDEIEKNISAQTIGQIIDLTDKTKVITQAVVIVQPNLFAKNIFYVAEVSEDGKRVNLDNKIQIYYSGVKNNDYKVGDVIKIIGTMATTKDERRIKVDSVNQPSIVKNISNINLSSTPLNEMGDCSSGTLLRVAGQLFDKKSNSLFVGQGDEVVKVYLKKESGLNAKEYNKGDWLTVTGVIDNQTGKELRLLPRQSTDIEKTVVAGMTEVATTTPVSNEKTFIENNNQQIDKKIIYLSLGVLILLISIWEFYERIIKNK